MTRDGLRMRARNEPTKWPLPGMQEPIQPGFVASSGVGGGSGSGYEHFVRPNETSYKQPGMCPICVCHLIVLVLKFVSCH